MEDSYTKLPNELMELLMEGTLNKGESKVLLLVARKTYGFHKKTDHISYSQFLKETGLSKPTLTNAIKSLRSVQLLNLVKRGNRKGASNEWLIDYTDYRVKLGKILNLRLKNLIRVGKILNLTKESITKEKHAVVENVSSKESYWDLHISKVLDSLEGIDPKIVNSARRQFITNAKFLSVASIRGFILTTAKNFNISEKQKGGQVYGEHIDPFKQN